MMNLEPNQPITKRVVLAQTSPLFDPLALVNPVIVVAKVFMNDASSMGIKIQLDTLLSSLIQSLKSASTFSRKAL